MAQSIMQLPDDFKTAHAAVDRRGLVGFRNVLGHDDLGVSEPRVWEIVPQDLPALKRAFEAMRHDLDTA